MQRGWARCGAILAVLGLGVLASAQVLFDFVSEAPRAEWYNDLNVRLPFPGADTDSRGFARVLPTAVLEDGRTYANVLETHPRWQPNGMVVGRYALTIPADAEFTAKVGFLRGATGTDGVTFELLWQEGDVVIRLAQVQDTYDGQLRDIRVDLGTRAGRRGTMMLIVRAGASSSQDWAVWVEPRLVRKTAAVGTPVFVRLVLDSLYCAKESRWDHGTDSDEPYLLVTALATHRSPSAWSTGEPEVFGDVDSDENRRLDPARPQRVVFEGEVPPGALIGFTAVVMEADAGTSPQRNQMAREIAEQLLAGPLKNVPGLEADPVSQLITDFITGNMLSLIINPLMYALGGGADDFIAANTVTLSYEQLQRWSRGDPHRPMVLDLDGGGSGHYKLRWHLEFSRGASRHFSAKFTHWDGFAAGNVVGTAEPEIVISIDEDAPEEQGKFYVYDRNGRLIRSWNGFYTHYDRVAIGDVLGDTLAEIIVASDDDGGQIRIYDGTGNKLRHFAAPFTKYDGLAVGNVLGDAKAEILIARDDDRQILIYSADGQRLRAFMVEEFRGCRYTADAESNRHDGFAVGDVVGDSFAEIVIGVNRNGSDSTVIVLNAFGQELRKTTVFFTHFDGFILADIFGNEKEEVLIAVDGGDGEAGLTIYALEIQTNTIARRFWPMFTKYDGLAASDLNGDGKDEILIATDEDDRVYIGI
ncbi:MAG: hypothetical protein ABDI20_06315 [Candidatus Bipolaricaulaceae bacterium]